MILDVLNSNSYSIELNIDLLLSKFTKVESLDKWTLYYYSENSKTEVRNDNFRIDFVYDCECRLLSDIKLDKLDIKCSLVSNSFQFIMGS